jgi:hypothetical protein
MAFFGFFKRKKINEIAQQLPIADAHASQPAIVKLESSSTSLNTEGPLALVSFTRDDSAPISEGMSASNQLLAGFVAVFNKKLESGYLIHYRVFCGNCGSLVIDDKDLWTSSYIAVSAWHEQCPICLSYSLSVGIRTPKERNDELIFSLNIDSAIPGILLKSERFNLEIVDIKTRENIVTIKFDDGGLCKVIKDQSLNKDARCSAMRKLGRKNWQEFFEEIACNDTDINIRYVATNYVEEPNRLERLLKRKDDSRILNRVQFKLLKHKLLEQAKLNGKLDAHEIQQYRIECTSLIENGLIDKIENTFKLTAKGDAALAGDWDLFSTMWD